jgi:hypothetical protein
MLWTCGMTLRCLAVSFALAAAACGSTTSPSTPVQTRVTVTSISPDTGAPLMLPSALPYVVPGGVVLPKSDGLVRVNVSVASAEPLSWARLNVYLLTGGSTTEYCGMNDPDAPTWHDLAAGWKTNVSITGYRVYRVPCDVTGVRVMLHWRNSGLFAPPGPEYTIAETIVPVDIPIRR